MKKIIIVSIICSLVICYIFIRVSLSYIHSNADERGELERIKNSIELNELVIFAKNELKDHDVNNFYYKSYHLDSIISKESRQKIEIDNASFEKYLISLSGYNPDKWSLKIHRTRSILEISYEHEIISTRIYNAGA
jgi:hypothetical protein